MSFNAEMIQQMQFDISEYCFPVINGAIVPSTTLAPVLAYEFPDTPAWQQGIVAGDAMADHAHKEYMAVSDFQSLIRTLQRNQANHYYDDAHMYELMTENRPVRPYFDLEWDAEQLDEGHVLTTVIPIILQCLHDVGFRTCRGLSIYTASGACSTRVIPSGKKSSFHVLFDTVEVFTNVAHHQEFVRNILLPYIKKDKDEYQSLLWTNTSHVKQLVIDAQPYNKHQTFRLPHQSKWVSGKSRPLILHDNHFGCPYSEVYTAGVYEDPATLTLISLERKPKPVPHTAITEGVESPDFMKMVELCTCLTPDFLHEYESTRNLIWMLWGTEHTTRMRDHIHRVCQRGANYEWKWVENMIKAYQFTGFTIGSLIMWARACSEGAVENILKKYRPNYYEELFQKTMKPAQHHIIHERYLGDHISFEDNDTVMVMSHLGTGKTVAITNFIRSQNIERLLIVSPRKSYTHSQLGVFLADVTLLPPLESYMDHMGSLSHLPYLIIQVESLHRIGEWFQPYDLVIMDESESILNQLHSTMTNGDNLVNNHQVFEAVLRTAKHVIFADAFMTDRTFHVAKELRNPAKTVLIENTFQPYSREAILLRKTDSDEVNLGAFSERILTALRAGRRIVVVWTSKHIGEEFEARLKKEKFSYIFYHSDSNRDDVIGLQNVRERWAGIQCLMMTTSITVGISYDPIVGIGSHTAVHNNPVVEAVHNNPVVEAVHNNPVVEAVHNNPVVEAVHGESDPRYDEAFLYGSSTTALPRDIAQSLLRVRVLKANRLTYVTNIPAYAVEQCGFTNVCNILAAKEDRLLKEHPLAKWSMCPPWARWNHAYNENERRCSCTYYKDVLERYLVNSGYTLKVELEDVPILAEEPVVLPSGIEWDDIPEITSEDAKEIRGRIHRGMADTLEKRSYQKFTFSMQFKECEEEVKKSMWVKYIESGKSEAFWNVVLEKRMSMEEMVRAEAKKRYAMMAGCRLKHRETMERFMGMIGLQHSQESIVVEHERLVEWGPALCAAEVELRAGMGLRASRRKGQWKVGNTIDLIALMLEEWGGGTVRSEAIITKEKRKSVREYTIYLNENSILWDSIRDSNAKMDEFMVKL